MKPFSKYSDSIACPVSVPVTDTPLRITLERKDGYRLGSKYILVLAIPNGAYAYLDMHVQDRNGAAVMHGRGIAVGTLGPSTLTTTNN